MVKSNREGTQFSTGENVGLLATGDLGLPGGRAKTADHATIATNDAGDIYVVWSSAINGEDDDVRRVEGAFFRRTALDTWKAYGTHTIAEGGSDATGWTSGAGRIYPNGDICRKPDVVSDGDDFFVCWPRIENSDGGGRLECCLAEVPVSGDITVHLPSTGIGHIVDAVVDPEQAGIMPDVAWDSVNSRFGVAYCELNSKQLTSPGTAYNFDLLATTLTFASPSSTPTIQTPQTLHASADASSPNINDLSFDDYSNAEGGNFGGGKILPDIEFDKHGQMVLIYEGWRRGFRDTAPADSTKNDGRIHLRRYSISGATFSLVGAASILYGGTATTLGAGLGGHYSQRRPMLYRGKDSTNEDYVYAIWMVDRRDNGQTQVEKRKLDYSSATGDPVVTNQTPSVIGGMREDVVLPFAFEDDVAYLAGIKFSNPRPTEAHSDGQNNTLVFRRPGELEWTELVEMSATLPWRPAIDGLENDPHSGAPANSGKMMLATEGKFIGFTRIYLTVIDDSVIRA